MKFQWKDEHFLNSSCVESNLYFSPDNFPNGLPIHKQQHILTQIYGGVYGFAIKDKIEQK